MAGTLTISTLSDGTNSTSSTNCIQGSAKAWVNFNGGTAAIRASYNVSSITRTGTGIYNINFTNSMPDANYSWVIGDYLYNTGSITNTGMGNISNSFLGIQVMTYSYSTWIDAAYISVSIFR